VEIGVALVTFYEVKIETRAERLNAAVLPPPAKRRGLAEVQEGKTGMRGAMWYVYVLLSEKTNRCYVGHTKDLKKRLEQHNNGKTRSLKAYLPMKIIYSEELKSKQEAYRREKQIKSYKGGEAFKRLIDD